MKKHSHGGGVSGLLPVIKPCGPTSHDIVDIARRALKRREVGHTGTLDPAAEGLLILCVGDYTKLSSFLVEHDKSYEGFLALGVATDSDDAQGAAVRACAPGTPPPSAKDIEAAAKKLRGKIEQIPPIYSAIKVDGKKLYEYARSGKPLQVDPRPVTVYSLEFGELQPASVPAQLIERTRELDPAIADATAAAPVWRLPFKCRVSSGTYIRSLARDLGNALNVGGHLAYLKRTHVGHISIDQAIQAETLRETPEAAAEFLLRGTACIDTAQYPVVVLKREFERILINGQPVHNRMMADPEAAATIGNGQTCVVAGEDGRLIAMALAMRADSVKAKQAYVAPFEVAFRSTRTFPNGLK